MNANASRQWTAEWGGDWGGSGALLSWAARDLPAGRRQLYRSL
jgi:hypothetical protein